MSTQFKQGTDPRRNTKGRPKGTPNRSTEQIRNMIADFIEANLKDIQSEYDGLEGKDKIILLERMIKHYLPPPPPENLLEGFSDMDLDILITHLRKKMN